MDLTREFIFSKFLMRSASESYFHDRYMFLRFIRLLIIIFLVFTISTFIIIIPVNAAYIPTVNKGLDRISWSKYVLPIYELVQQVNPMDAF